MSGITLDGRLLAAAAYVRQNAVLADIGTDHGHLPLFLLRSGRISRAILTDINEGPLSAARENLLAAGLIDSCELLLTDGAAELADRGITDLAVCGMGGELIARIISDAPYLCREGVRLILQPMTRQAALRERLFELGYSILAEHYSMADGRCYVCFVAEYGREPSSPDPVTRELGDASVACGAPEAIRGYLESRRASLLREREGRRIGGLDTDGCDLLLSELDARLSSIADAP